MLNGFSQTYIPLSSSMLCPVAFWSLLPKSVALEWFLNVPSMWYNLNQEMLMASLVLCFLNQVESNSEELHGNILFPKSPWTRIPIQIKLHWTIYTAEKLNRIWPSKFINSVKTDLMNKQLLKYPKQWPLFEHANAPNTSCLWADDSCHSCLCDFLPILKGPFSFYQLHL